MSTDDLDSELTPAQQTQALLDVIDEGGVRAAFAISDLTNTAVDDESRRLVIAFAESAWDIPRRAEFFWDLVAALGLFPEVQRLVPLLSSPDSELRLKVVMAANQGLGHRARSWEDYGSRYGNPYVAQQDPSFPYLAEGVFDSDDEVRAMALRSLTDHVYPRRESRLVTGVLWKALQTDLDTGNRWSALHGLAKANHPGTFGHVEAELKKLLELPDRDQHGTPAPGIEYPHNLFEAVDALGDRRLNPLMLEADERWSISASKYGDTGIRWLRLEPMVESMKRRLASRWPSVRADAVNHVSPFEPEFAAVQLSREFQSLASHRDWDNCADALWEAAARLRPESLIPALEECLAAVRGAESSEKAAHIAELEWAIVMCSGDAT